MERDDFAGISCRMRISVHKKTGLLKIKFWKNSSGTGTEDLMRKHLIQAGKGFCPFLMSAVIIDATRFYFNNYSQCLY